MADNTSQVNQSAVEPFHSKPATTFAITLKPAYDRYWALYKSKKFTDLTLICKETQFKVHRIVLAATSVKLNHMLCEDENIECLSYDIDPHLMSATLECLYKGSLSDVPEDLAEGLANTAKQLGVREMEIQCLTIYLHKLTATEDNCLDVCQLALEMDNKQILEKFQTVAMMNFSSLQKHCGFTRMNVHAVKWYLGHSQLHVDSHEDRLTAALNWLKFDKSGRLSEFPSILNSLPLQSMNIHFLKHIAEYDADLSVHYPSRRLLLAAVTATPASPSIIQANTCQVMTKPSDQACATPEVNTRPSIQRGQGQSVMQTCTAVVWGRTAKIHIYPPSFGDAHRVVQPPSSVRNEMKFTAAYCSVRQTLYVSGIGEDKKQVWCYDVSNDFWDLVAKLARGRWFHSMAAVANELLVFAGNHVDAESNRMMTTVEVLNLNERIFREAGHLQGAQCSWSHCCVRGFDTLVVGAIRSPLIGRRSPLLQVYSSTEQSVIHVITLPEEFADIENMERFPHGIVCTDEHVIVSNASDQYVCPIRALYRNSSDQIQKLRSYKSPVKGALLSSGGDGQVLLLGGNRPNPQKAIIYKTRAADMVEDGSEGWVPVAVSWRGDDVFSLSAACPISLSINLLP